MLRISGLSLRAIARHLGRHHSVICREIARNREDGAYHAEKEL
ncbi:MAG: hypothetical protein EAY65_07455 [Alphaproteobacteria bacterium]|nr:MAG: hypothetical protein EAY65_07455 [Alphaproteobacteria bacterium]